MSVRPRVKRITFTGVSVVLTACAADTTLPTEAPPLDPVLPASAVVPSAWSSRENLASAVDDALLRILPALEDDQQVTALRAALLDLASALSQPLRPIAPLLPRIDALLDALARNADGEAGVLAELDAMRLITARAGGL